MGKEKAFRSRWRFPELEGIMVREETGEWSDGAFFNDLNPDDPVPEVWYQAQPQDNVIDPNVWKRWLIFWRPIPMLERYCFVLH